MTSHHGIVNSNYNNSGDINYNNNFCIALYTFVFKPVIFRRLCFAILWQNIKITYTI